MPRIATTATDVSISISQDTNGLHYHARWTHRGRFPDSPPQPGNRRGRRMVCIRSVKNRRRPAMRVLLTLSAAALVAAGCASTGNTQVAEADCKVQPITTTSVTDTHKTQVSSLRQREAEAALATSDYRFRNLQRQNA